MNVQGRCLLQRSCLCYVLFVWSRPGAGRWLAGARLLFTRLSSKAVATPRLLTPHHVAAFSSLVVGLRAVQFLGLSLADVREVLQVHAAAVKAGETVNLAWCLQLARHLVSLVVAGDEPLGIPAAAFIDSIVSWCLGENDGSVTAEDVATLLAPDEDAVISMVKVMTPRMIKRALIRVLASFHRPEIKRALQNGIALACLHVTPLVDKVRSPAR